MKLTDKIQKSASSDDQGIITRPGKLLLACFSLISLTWLAHTPLAARECAKVVFNQYCLGGETDTSIAHLTDPPTVTETDDGNTIYSFVENGKTIMLQSQDNLTLAVTRLETPGGWINYTSWKVKLVRLYGRGSDLSDFPAYAGSRSSRLNAINAGRGHAEFEWDQTHYRIKLIWDNPDFIKLQYLLTTDNQTEPDNSEGL